MAFTLLRAFYLVRPALMASGDGQGAAQGAPSFGNSWWRT